EDQRLRVDVDVQVLKKARKISNSFAVFERGVAAPELAGEARQRIVDPVLGSFSVEQNRRDDENSAEKESTLPEAGSMAHEETNNRTSSIGEDQAGGHPDPSA